MPEDNLNNSPAVPPAAAAQQPTQAEGTPENTVPTIATKRRLDDRASHNLVNTKTSRNENTNAPPMQLHEKKRVSYSPLHVNTGTDSSGGNRSKSVVPMVGNVQ